MDIVIGILEKDEAELKRKIDLVRDKASRLHIDIIDRQFADNLTIGIDTIRSLGTLGNLAVHLMITEVDGYLASWCQTPVGTIIFYPKESKDIQGSIERIHSAGKKAGLALDIDDKVELVRPYIKETDFILVLTVPSGFSGAEFDPHALHKIGQLKSLKPDLVMGVDGGLNKKTLIQAKDAGANFAVVNSAIFSSSDPASMLDELTQLVS